MTMRLATLACTLLVLALAAPASASIPAPTSTKIVPATSLGGVTLGQSMAAANQAWGGGGACLSSSCSFLADRDTRGFNGRGYFGFAADKITNVFIQPPRHSYTGAYLYKGPLMKLKTSKGIGLGARLKDLKAAYPKVKLIGRALWSLKSGKRQTTFSFNLGRVYQVSIDVFAK
jgi:hypothetical protein